MGGVVIAGLILLSAAMFGLVRSIPEQTVRADPAVLPDGPVAAGGEEAAPPTGPAQPLAVELGDIWIRTEAELKAGTYEITATNSGAMPHMLAVEREPIGLDPSGAPTEENAVAHIETIAPGTSEKVRVRLERGSYQFYCNIPGHYQAGQTTTVKVG